MCQKRASKWAHGSPTGIGGRCQERFQPDCALLVRGDLHMHFSSRSLRARLAGLVLLGGFLLAGPGPTAAGSSPEGLGCDAEALAEHLPAEVDDVSITSAEIVTAPVRHCRVNGSILTPHPLTGAPAANTVNWMVALPDDHNGRYFFVGLGGTAGFVPNPPAAVIGQGYAVAGTDTGTADHPGVDYSLMLDPTKAHDHDRRGGHLSAVVTQALTKAYYDSDTLFRYHSGCSGGGRMGTTAAIWHPEDYDGVIVGAPGRGLGNMLHFGKGAQHVYENPDGVIDTATLQAIGARILADFDAVDGAVDGMIWDPSVVSYTEQELDALFDDFGLTEAQRDTIEVIRSGYDLGGDVSQHEYPLSSIQFWDQWMPNPAVPFGSFVGWVFGSFAQGSFGLDYNFLEDGFDFTSLEDEAAFMAPFQEMNSQFGFQFGRNSTGDLLTTFGDTGGKILSWHGVHDNVITWNNAPATYHELVEASGGLDEARSWARLFAVPGISHCGGGDGPQDVPLVALEALARWVENDDAPDELIGTRPADGRTFKMCPYPEASVFLGGADNPYGLDVNNASHWVCEGASHGHVVSAAARACPKGPGHGACVRQWAQSNPGKS